MARKAPLKATGRARAPSFVSYLRVSTDEQGVSGLDPEAQQEAIDRHIRAAGGKLLSEHIEVEFGKNNDRQQLQPCHLARLARNQVRPSASGALCGSRRERLGGAQTRAGRS